MLKLNFLLTLMGTLGSLYFSEIMKFPPCTLCWYQRICLYPLVLVFGAALLTNDQGYKKYALPLAIVGLLISLYHNLLYFGVIAAPLVPCTADVSCSARQLELFGFITIPLMSMMSFIVIIGLVFFDRKKKGKI